MSEASVASEGEECPDIPGKGCARCACPDNVRTSRSNVHFTSTLYMQHISAMKDIYMENRCHLEWQMKDTQMEDRQMENR